MILCSFYFGGRFLQKLRKSAKVPSPSCPSLFPDKNKNNPRELQDEIGYTTAEHCTEFSIVILLKSTWRHYQMSQRINSWEQLPIDIQYLDGHIICRSTYSILYAILYVDRDTSMHVCRSTYCMLIDIQYLDWHTVIDRHAWCVCWSTYCMSIDILYVNRDTVSIGCCA